MAANEGAFRTCIISITKHSAHLGAKLHEQLPDSDFFVMPKLAGEAPTAQTFPETVRAFIGKAFYQYDGLIMFISLGAVVRMIAEHVVDKKVDPAVVVVDDRARYAIAVLSGHVGGANSLTRRIADIMGATPVITTASDVGETIPVDLLGREFGWEIASWENATAVSAHVVNEEPIGFYQSTGERGWWAGRTLPKTIHLFDDLNTLAAAPMTGALIVTDRLLGPEYADLLKKAVLYRPKSLTVGVGCTRGTSAADIEVAVLAALEANGLAAKSIRSLATIEVKRDEAGINEFARKLRVPVEYFTQEQLNGAVGITHQSEAAMKHVGAVGVSEPAALLAAGVEQLTVAKFKRGMVTVAVARREFA
ncbi:MAG: cobalamin biosynthesis protein [Chloroflexi bacterium]|nr:cobalamin biosynthesis protein [Chloroflexota bacterium]